MPLSSQISAYADDNKLIGDVSKTRSLSADMFAVEKWWKANSMMINVKKCGALHLGNNNPMHEYEIYSTLPT